MPVYSCTSLICTFDKSPTVPIILFELFVIFSTLWLIFYFKNKTKKLIRNYLILFVGVLIFEIFTTPLFNNFKMGRWAYLYGDVSWILTLAWTTGITLIILLIDKFIKNLKQWQKFAVYILSLTPIILLFESLVVKIGLRSYSTEVIEYTQGLFLPILDVPIVALYYVPVFLLLVISFFKYWVIALDEKPTIPIKKAKWLRNLAIAFIGVILYEIIVDPLVISPRFPAWSYLYRDISIIMTGFWIILIWITSFFIEKYFLYLKLTTRFFIIMILSVIISAPAEAWMVNSGYRVYGPSAVANFSGITSLVFHIPIEIVLAIPIYLVIVISFIRYWQIVFDNQL